MKYALLLFLFILLPASGIAKLAPLNVTHVTVKEGLNDGVINAICQDKYGFMWIANQGALVRYDGISVKSFTHVQGDSTSPPNSSPVTLTYDSNDRLWIGYSTGLVEYDFATGKFKQLAQFKNQFVYLVLSISKDVLFVATNDETYLYNTKTNKTETYLNSNDTLSKSINDENYIYDFCLSNGKIYMSSHGCILIYDTQSKKITLQKIKSCEAIINRIYADEEGQLWVSAFETRQLFKINPKDFSVRDMSYLLEVEGDRISVSDFVTDNKHNLWMLGSKKAIIKLTQNGEPKYYQYNNAVPSNLLASIFKTMYCSRNGHIWFTCLTGIGYFHPDKNIFDVYYPFKDSMTSKFSKVLYEDSRGNIWCATPSGVTLRNDAKNEFTVFNAESGSVNNIYSSQVNAITEDKNGRIWIATSHGINQYDYTTGKMKFFSEKDSLPVTAYFTCYTDHDNTVWFGTALNKGLYYYTGQDNKFHSAASHPLLNRFQHNGVRCFYQDTKGRVWFGFNGQGLGMYDEKQNTVHYWYNNDNKNEKTISGNLILDIKEDKTGVIWLSTHNGTTGISDDFKQITVFNAGNGLHSNYCGPLAVDSLNRLWIGTTRELVVLSSDRKNMSYFDQRDGLVSSSFLEYESSKTADGNFYFPTVNGFIKFNPLDFKEERQQLDYYLESYSVFSKEYSYKNNSAAAIVLKPEENYISFKFVSPYYNQSQQILYAYKLENYDKEWNYTSERVISYTKIPPGNYKLLYKACINNVWPETSKQIDITINNHFYRTGWFKILVVVVLLFILWKVYRFRMQKLREVAELNDRAQLLEREKSVVQYENLKQQLNPHFLFNSLTSLNSLITVEPKTARKFVEQMSKIYRYILRSSENETVPLIDEINFANNYIQLQKTRFSEGLEVNMHVEEEYNYLKVVPVTIQNLLENAIKHNVVDAESPLMVEIFVKDNYLVVKNNMQKKSTVETSNKLGLNQMKSLYSFLIDKPIIIKEDINYFEIQVPLI